MILQTNKQLHREINKNGCAFMAALFHAVRQGKIEIDSTKDINELFDTAVSLRTMSKNSYVKDWDGLFDLFNLPVQYTGRHEPPEKECEDNQIELLHFEGHFTAGNGKGIVTYDPWGISNAAQGPLLDKRIFTIG